MGAVVHLRKFQTAEQVLDAAKAADLKHIVVLGIKNDGGNYFEANRLATLLELVWLVFCGNDSVQRMVNGK